MSGQIDGHRKHVILNNIPFHISQFKIGICIFQCPSRMVKTMKSALWNFLVPVIQKIIMQQGSSEQSPLIYLPVPFFCQPVTDISYTHTMTVYRSFSMLYILFGRNKLGFLSTAHFSQHIHKILHFFTRHFGTSFTIYFLFILA